MNDLLKLIGLSYVYKFNIQSVPDDVNVIKKTNYAYHVQCKVGILQPKGRWSQVWEEYYWKCDMNYLSSK